jgi:uncharacterized protein with beta-barrel porin domain
MRVYRTGPRISTHSLTTLDFTVALITALFVVGPSQSAWAAQCSNIPNPGPPAPPAQTDFSNQSFGAPPLPPYFLNAHGQKGCDGASASGINEPGEDGFAGQPGGSFSSVNTGISIQGGAVLFVNGFPTGAGWYATGGDGGVGGQGGPNLNGAATTGNGGAGGASGSISVQFSGAVGGDASGNLPEFGLIVETSGGEGGSGADSNAGGGQPLFGGGGGAGGRAGQAMLNASGDVDFYTLGVAAVASGGGGGRGGDSPTPIDLFVVTHGGEGGAGGAGGVATVVYQNGALTAPFSSAPIYPLEAVADGGSGGFGGQTRVGIGAFGGDGGAGGNGGSSSAILGVGGVVTFTATQQPVDATYQPSSGVSAIANGGRGGDGGTIGGAAIRDGGGAGGAGGAGGSASADVLGSIAFTSQLPSGEKAAGFLGGETVLVQANGGGGGPGAGAEGSIIGIAGNGGPAGNGGAASLILGDATNTATLKADGSFTHGALVQSVGGGGGDGGSVSFVLVGAGGAGAAGGNGGPVTVKSDHALVTVGSTSGQGGPSGEGSVPLLVQSIGGGGGTGGDTSGVTVGTGYEIGGNSGRGGDGGSVNIGLGQYSVFASLDPNGGAGILAQSIGGSGGNAGSATSTGVGLITLVVGGDAKGGGVGGPVAIDNAGLVTTYGDHAYGIEAQSIGGGGGNGGSATAFTIGGPMASAVALGGRGGDGGAAGAVSLTNTGQVSTYGPNSGAVLLQSIGGGGGAGGSATARSVALSPDPKIPAVSFSFAIGGGGGKGNTGGDVTLDNSGLITTAGHSAIGMMAQSIGGGGGVGGDATAAAYSASAEKGASLSIAVALGGTGGLGGKAGAVDLTNSGLIATMGQDAYGVFAQSTGGGGGAGGAGDAFAAAADAKASFGVSIGVGGSGGIGGDGGAVGLDNSGSIVTVGDGSAGVFAQSVGGGGGAAGGGTATASGGKLAVSVGVGGDGGVGGLGKSVTLTNSGSILTRGTDAIGVWAQSVGGGGGVAGKAGATAGGVTTLSNEQAMFDTLANGLNIDQNVTEVYDKVLQIGQIGENIKAGLDELLSIFPQPQAENPEEGTSIQINVAVSVGGQGGAAGAGGAVTLTNTGQIATFGAQSDAVVAESVGGGGGKGGAATSTGIANNDDQSQTAIAVGGSGGGGGSGGMVNVTNAAGGFILTKGVAAFGVNAHSVGGGGGEAGAAGVVAGSFKSLSVAVGGNGGGAGDGGAVDVTTGDGGSIITTLGKHGIGIVAQSVGGGGGIVRTMTTDQTFDPAKLIDNPQGRVADLQGLSLSLGGKNGASGNGGSVQVTTSGAVVTSGLDAHGIVAQSIGAGGGLVIGGQVFLPSSTGVGGGNGNGGAVTLSLDPGTLITTAGDGAYGVIAQSIGGGGGFAGDPSQVYTYQTGAHSAVTANNGTGGTVSITAQNATIDTDGNMAPGIFAQSIGGGGGVVVSSPAVSPRHEIEARGTAGGSGGGGAVTIKLVNSTVSTTGVDSPAILAQSDGSTRGAISISIDSQSVVSGGHPPNKNFPQPDYERDDAAIRLLGGSGNTITNAGVIEGINSGPVGYAHNAIRADGPVAITNTGKIIGDIWAPGAASLLDNQAGGMVNSTAINMGAGLVRNAGVMEIGGANTIGQTTITGNLVQSSTGTLIVDIANTSADHLSVNGTASLQGRLVALINDPADLRSGSRRLVNILTATGGVTEDGLQAVSPTPIVQYSIVPNPQDLSLSYIVDFSAAQALQAAGLLSRNRLAVGNALNTIMSVDNDAFDALVTGFANATSAQQVATTLDSLSSEVAADAQQAVLETQEVFSINTLRHVVTGNDGGGASSLYVALADLPPPTTLAGFRVWAGGFGASDVLDGVQGLGALHTQIAGGQIGLDKWLGRDALIGVTLGGAGTNFQVWDRDSSGHASSANIGAYGLWRLGEGYVSGIATYGNYAVELERNGIGAAVGLNANARGSMSSNVLGGRAEVGWRHRVGEFELTPFAALEVDHIWQGGFAESITGGLDTNALALQYASVQHTAAPLTLGGRAGTTFQVLGGQRLALSAEVGWVHEFNPDTSITAAFAGASGAPFGIQGVSASRNAAQVSLDAKLELSSTMSAFASFTGRFSGVETAVGGIAGLRVVW